MPILDNRHTLDRALAFHPDAVNLLAAVGAAQLAQAVETGQSGHGALHPFNCPTEKGEALQVGVGQRSKIQLTSRMRGIRRGT